MHINFYTIHCVIITNRLISMVIYCLAIWRYFAVDINTVSLESRRSPWKTVICITLCAVFFHTCCIQIQYNLHYTWDMTPYRLLLTYLYNTSYNGFPCVITYHCTFPFVNVNHWMIKARPLLKPSKSKPLLKVGLNVKPKLL